MVCSTLRFGAALALLASLGCSSSEERVSPAIAPRPGPEEWNREVQRPSDAEAADKRSACAYGAGALPAETHGASRPSGEQIPIDHIVVMMMENRSFDHYFQKLPEYGQPEVDVAPDDYKNPDTEGAPTGLFHDRQYCFVDTNHSWNGTHRQVNAGKMDGFIVTNDGEHERPTDGTLDLLDGRRALGYYDGEDLPFYYWLANEFAIGDRYFSSVQGPTLVNRMYLYGASSFGEVINTFVSERTTLIDNLEKREVDWKIYATGTPGFSSFVDDMIEYSADHLRHVDDFMADAKAGRLPQVSFVDPNIGRSSYDNDDEHPPAMAQVGQRLVARVLDALTKSPHWPRSAFFLSYDEHGGLYDHVVPPPACPPDDIPPELADGDEPGAFDEYGVRVPFIVVSPYAKPHYVGHQVYDHTSITRFIEARFVLPALSGRDANAEAPWDMFDFDAPSFATPPTIALPNVPTDKLEACKAIFGP